MQIEYNYPSVVGITRLVYNYMYSPGADTHKDPWSKSYLRFAKRILDVETDIFDGGWYMRASKARVHRRLRSAGIDPETWEIVDEKAAAWAWFQLRTTRRFAEKRQKQLMDSDEPVPPLDFVFKYSTQRAPAKVPIEARPDMNREIRDWIRDRQ